jgi:uncharacterized protein (TIGR00106 family)
MGCRWPPRDDDVAWQTGLLYRKLVRLLRFRRTRKASRGRTLPSRSGVRDDYRMIAAFSINPVGAGESVSKVVGECIAIVRASGLPNETNAMFTNLEGDWNEVMGVIKECVEHVAAAAPRVSVVIKIDHRQGVSGALRSKVESIERQLSST